MYKDCDLKSANVSLPQGIPVIQFAGIPEHLLFYGFFMVFSIIIYMFIINHQVFQSGGKSYLMILLGREDEWIVKERGVSAYHFIMFLRMFLNLAGIFSVISGISLVIHVSQGDSGFSTFELTTSNSIPHNSKLHWFNLVISFFTPWLVIYKVWQMSKKFGLLKPMTKTFSSTLFIENNPLISNIAEVVEYFERKYPNYEMIDIAWSPNTEALQDLVTDLNFAKDCLEIVTEKGGQESRTSCCSVSISKDTEFYEKRIRNLSLRIQEEREEALKKPGLILFLTFRNHSEAKQVYRREKLMPKFYSLKGQITFAPLPEEILWKSINSFKTNIISYVIATILIFFLVIFVSTPAGFAKQIEQQLIRHIFGDTSEIAVVSKFLPILLLILFNALVPMAVKVARVDFGSCSRTISHPNYMRSLYMWLTCSTIIFPIILASAGNMLEFFLTIGSEGLQVALHRWQCVYSASTGAFYINLMIVAAFMKCQLELHRVGDFLRLFWIKLLNCRYLEQMEAASRNFRNKILNRRNGERLFLAEDYVWTIIYFSIWMVFCLTCPVITPAFLIFIFCKYLVVVQNFKCYYTATENQPELVTTAAKLSIVASIFPQVNFTLLMIIRQWMKENEDHLEITLMTIFLLAINLLLLFILHKNNWNFPVKLFRHSRPSYDQQETFCYENPFLYIDLSNDDIEEGIERRRASWLSQKRRRIYEYLPQDKIFSRTLGNFATWAVHQAAKNLV